MKKTDKIKEFSKMRKEELNRLLLEKKEKLRQLRFDLAGGRVKNIRDIKEVKKDIARIKGFLKIFKP